MEKEDLSKDREKQLFHARRRVVGPNEEAPEDDFYSLPKVGSDARLPLNHTALREAERRFKSRLQLSLNLPHALDLWKNAQNAIIHHSVRRAQVFNEYDGDDACPVYAFSNIPGLLIIPRLIPPKEQLKILHDTFSSYIHPPNATNLDAHFEYDSRALWKYLLSDETGPLLVTKMNSSSSSSLSIDNHEKAKEFLQRIRWATLGYQYNWTTKEYYFDRQPAPFPERLSVIARQIAEAAGFGKDFRAEAGIVNFYQLDDSLTSHVDRSEPNMDAPLISIRYEKLFYIFDIFVCSLGSSCIFLVGGEDRNDPVTPFVLHSGDVLILSGLSRRFFHGVPRILPDSTPMQLLNEYLDFPIIAELMQNARINLNIRQVTK